jgi:hypothetical protein
MHRFVLQPLAIRLERAPGVGGHGVRELSGRVIRVDPLVSLEGLAHYVSSVAALRWHERPRAQLAYLADAQAAAAKVAAAAAAAEQEEEPAAKRGKRKAGDAGTRGKEKEKEKEKEAAAGEYGFAI